MKRSTFELVKKIVPQGPALEIIVPSATLKPASEQRPAVSLPKRTTRRRGHTPTDGGMHASAHSSFKDRRYHTQDAACAAVIALASPPTPLAVHPRSMKELSRGMELRPGRSGIRVAAHRGIAFGREGAATFNAIPLQAAGSMHKQKCDIGASCVINAEQRCAMK
eukprot:CAMPEP_0119363794 /NCGR_PEP_ID=MMETSP1334-20130426/10723_1 /TAXON_ID=127549 /ORGANISM="Calcidiscus leptoporus, Strain RCC1130" /LENGTH=164 /DNA_ID=CAMNT_0007379337 /DNA_START=227 /DNA_END=719 /DNA_ORIENTATION=+